MRVALPVGKGRQPTLAYVLRSLAENAGVTEVVTVGERPEGIEPDLHIDSPNTGKPHDNVAGHLRRVAELGEHFVWCDDDMFTMRPWVPAVYVRAYSIAGMLRLYPSRGHWSHAVRNSIKVMQSWGFDPEQVPAGTVHRPSLVSPNRALMVLDALDAVGGGSFRALYVTGMDGLIEAGDPKVTGRTVPRPDADVISVDPLSWRTNAGRIIRDRFTEAVRWEVSTVDTGSARSDLLRGPRRHHRR